MSPRRSVAGSSERFERLPGYLWAGVRVSDGPPRRASPTAVAGRHRRQHLPAAGRGHLGPAGVDLPTPGPRRRRLHPRPDSRMLRSAADAARGRLRTVDRATPPRDPACRRSRHRRPGGVRPRVFREHPGRRDRYDRARHRAHVGHHRGAEHHGPGGQLARAHQQVRHAHHCLGARPDRRPGTRRGDHRPQRRAEPRVDIVGPADRGLGLHRRSARRRSGYAHPDPGVDRPHGPGRAGMAPPSPTGDVGRADDQLLGQERR